MPILRKCCCCAKLQTGGVILGWLGIIGATLSLIFTFIGFAFLEEIVDQISSNPETKQHASTEKLVVALLLTSICLNIVSLAASICLLTGSIKQKRLLLVPWLVSEMGAILLFVIYILIDFIAIFNHEEIEFRVLSFIISLVFLGFDIYLWICVYSLYQMICEEEMSVSYGSELIKHDANDGLPPYHQVV